MKNSGALVIIAILIAQALGIRLAFGAETAGCSCLVYLRLPHKPIADRCLENEETVLCTWVGDSEPHLWKKGPNWKNEYKVVAWPNHPCGTCPWQKGEQLPRRGEDFSKSGYYCHKYTDHFDPYRDRPDHSCPSLRDFNLKVPSYSTPPDTDRN